MKATAAQSLLTTAIFAQLAFPLCAENNAGLDQPDYMQGLCSVFEAKNLDEVTDSEELLYLGLVSDLRSLKCRDTNRAKSLLERSAMQGNADAQFHLCQWYTDRADIENAVAWCVLAKDNGSEQAAFTYDFLTANAIPTGVSAGREKARELRAAIEADTNQQAKPTP